MICSLCGGSVTWRGPLTALTHTECSGCGGRNCQVADIDEPESAVIPNDMALVKRKLLERAAWLCNAHGDAITICGNDGDKWLDLAIELRRAAAIGKE